MARGGGVDRAGADYGCVALPAHRAGREGAGKGGQGSSSRSSSTRLSSRRTRISPATRATKRSDVAKLAGAGAHLVWAPAVAEMYPEGFATHIFVEGAGAAARRPVPAAPFRRRGDGGASCSRRLCRILRCSARSDFQQLAVIRQMVRDLALPVAVQGVPTVREDDGSRFFAQRLPQRGRTLHRADALARRSRRWRAGAIHARRRKRCWPPASRRSTTSKCAMRKHWGPTRPGVQGACWPRCGSARRG